MERHVLAKMAMFMSTIEFVRTYFLCASPMNCLGSCVVVLKLLEIYILQ